MHNYTFMACPQMSGLANRVASQYYEREIDTSPLISWQEFERGFPNIWIDTDFVCERDVIFLASFDNPAECFRQWCVLRAIARYGANSLRIILPFFSTGTMDRVIERGEVATAKSMACLLDAIPASNHGKPKVVVFDIHALQEEFFWEASFCMPVTAMDLPKQLMLDRYREQVRINTASADFYQSYAVCFPDEGAKKRFSKEFSAPPWEQIICDKVRAGDKRIVTVKEGNTSGRHLMIVDDMTRTGGTAIKCAEAVRKQNPLSVSAFVTHGAFDEPGFAKIIAALESGVLDNFYITDSCPWAVEMIAQAGCDRIKVLSLDRLIVDYLLKLDALKEKKQ